jgi:hypothetical protein
MADGSGREDAMMRDVDVRGMWMAVEKAGIHVGIDQKWREIQHQK